MSNIKNIYISSAPGFRDNGGTDENFTITKQSSVFNLLPKRVKLLSANIPYTWNNITSSNNAFTLIELPGPTTHSNVTIPVGHYTGTSLATILQDTLNAIVGVVHTYTVVYNTTTFKFTISATGFFQFNFTIANSIAQALGFDEIITASSNSITSNNVAVINPDSEIFITSNLVGGIDNGVIPYFTGSTSDLKILASIPCTSCFGGTINYMANELEPWYLTSQSAFSMIPLTSGPVVLTFGLFFLSGIPVNLFGAHWSANILLEF